MLRRLPRRVLARMRGAAAGAARRTSEDAAARRRGDVRHVAARQGRTSATGSGLVQSPIDIGLRESDVAAGRQPAQRAPAVQHQHGLRARLWAGMARAGTAGQDHGQRAGLDPGPVPAPATPDRDGAPVPPVPRSRARSCHRPRRDNTHRLGRRGRARPHAHPLAPELQGFPMDPADYLGGEHRVA